MACARRLRPTSPGDNTDRHEICLARLCHRNHVVAPLSSAQLDESVAEVWLFHGTSPRTAANIVDIGFRIDYTKPSPLAPAVYFTDSWTRADELTAPDETGLRTILVCRVALGRVCRLKDNTLSAPVDNADSVLTCRGYFEYAIFDESQAYAEYEVNYRRVKGGTA
eukprot:NODE_20258_length_806_cov_2.123711.p1 GENE.NODE_20258_length_806_cov_2.123711~~NODE_20258_length_806_cov_2.123711.p1  ORF type:complete len:166 (-),score=28.86 NODE_20258_length_806_cov_2.123711:119-616(-)